MTTRRTFAKNAFTLVLTGALAHGAALAGVWQDTAVQKAKAAETISAIKYNAFRASTPAQTARDLKRRGDEEKQLHTAQFTRLIQEVYKYPQDRARVLERHAKLQKELNKIPAFSSYVITVEHPADLYDADEATLDLAARVFASFNARSGAQDATPASALLFPSGALVVRFDVPSGKPLHLAFKPLDMAVKVVIGDFTMSEREFGSNPKTLELN